MPNPLYERLIAPLQFNDKAFLILQDDRKISGAAFHEIAVRQANALSALGLGPDDRLAVQVPKTPEALALYAACIMLGAVFLPLNTAYTANELDYFLADSGAAIIVCDPGGAEAIGAIAVRTGAQLLTLDAAGSGSLSEAASGQPTGIAIAERTPGDLAALLYTSGTTGRSKGAMLTQENLLSNALVLADVWRFTESDVLLHALPIYHTHGLFVASNVVMASGASMIFLPKFDLDQIFGLMPKASTLMGVPTFYTRLLSDRRLTVASTRHMRLFISGSAPLLEETSAAFEARTGHRILERYGMTETSMLASNPYDGERRAGTVGRMLPGVTLRITDPATGTPLPQGEVGMIEARGPNVFKGYWHMPKKTAAEFRSDGFFITGDIGMMDEDGYFHIVGREKDLIISGGFNIYPKEIELFLDEQPGVLESAVVGVPHPDFGEAVLAVLVPEPGATIDLDQLRQSARHNLAGFKQPKAVILAEELPRNVMGKVQKAVLRNRHSHLFV